MFVSEHLISELEELFDGAITDRPIEQLLILAENVRSALDRELIVERIPYPFNRRVFPWTSAMVFMSRLDAYIEMLKHSVNDDASDLRDTQADALGTLW